MSGVTGRSLSSRAQAVRLSPEAEPSDDGAAFASLGTARSVSCVFPLSGCSGPTDQKSSAPSVHPADTREGR